MRAAYTAMIDLRQYNLYGDREAYNSLVETLTTAGLSDRVIFYINEEFFFNLIVLVDSI